MSSKAIEKENGSLDGLLAVPFGFDFAGITWASGVYQVMNRILQIISQSNKSYILYKTFFRIL
jgi:hypothetical protein